MIKTSVMTIACSAGIWLGTLGGMAQAQTTSLPINKCLAGKIKAVGKSVARRVNCWGKGWNDADGRACFAEERSWLQDKFGDLESEWGGDSDSPCLAFEDEENFDDDITNFAASVPELTGNAPGKCDRAKTKNTLKYLSGTLKCHVKAAAKTGTVDHECTDKAEAKLLKGLDKALAKNDCTHADIQVGALRASADQFIQLSLRSLVTSSLFTQCPNDCSGSDHGVCRTNGCICFEGYTGLDCSIAMDGFRVPEVLPLGYPSASLPPFGAAEPGAPSSDSSYCGYNNCYHYDAGAGWSSTARSGAPAAAPKLPPVTELPPAPESPYVDHNYCDQSYCYRRQTSGAWQASLRWGSELVQDTPPTSDSFCSLHYCYRKDGGSGVWSSSLIDPNSVEVPPATEVPATTPPPMNQPSEPMPSFCDSRYCYDRNHYGIWYSDYKAQPHCTEDTNCADGSYCDIGSGTCVTGCRQFPDDCGGGRHCVAEPNHICRCADCTMSNLGIPVFCMEGGPSTADQCVEVGP